MAHGYPKWITFEARVQFDGRSVKGICVDGPKGESEAHNMAAAGRTVITSVNPLPYPAEPRIPTWEYSCPSFCFDPITCQGRTSCPRRRSCCD